MILWLTLSTALIAAGQAPSLRGIEGTVRDVSGRLLPGALVTATSVETGMKSVTTSDRRDGSFAISNLALGKYRVTVQLDGYLTQTQEPVTVWTAHVFSRLSVSLLTFLLQSLSPCGRPSSFPRTPLDRFRLIR